MDRLISLSKNNANFNGDAENGDPEEGSDDDEEDGSEEEESDDEDEDKFSDLVYDSESETESKNSSLKKSKPKRPIQSEGKKNEKPKILTDEERKAMMLQAEKELPYTFELCYKYEELEKLLKKYSAEYQAVILERMIKCNHPKVEPANREKMVTLFAFLLQYINDLASGDAVHCFTVLDRILPFLYDLSHINPADTTKCFLEVIKEKQSDFRGSKQFPNLDTLVFLKIVSNLYSTSDFRHSIASPCVIFISQILTHSRVSTRSDISSGLFLVTVLLEYTQLSKRFLPAALNFLAGVLYLAIRKRSVHRIKVVPPFKSSGDTSSLLVLKKPSAFDGKDYRLMATDFSDEPIDNSFKIRALNTAVMLTQKAFSNLDKSGLQLLVEPFTKFLDKIDLNNYPQACKANVSSLLKLFDAINSEPLAYLVPEMKRPKTLRQLEPKYERIFDDRRDRSKNAGKAAIRKGLQRKIKKETKGAVREIRRDNAFLSKVQHKRKLQRYVFHTPQSILCMNLHQFTFFFYFLVTLSVKIKFDAYSLKLQSNKVNSMQSIEKRNTCKIKSNNYVVTINFFMNFNETKLRNILYFI